MSQLLVLNYVGNSATFLDDQVSSVSMFGQKPQLFRPNPSRLDMNVSEKLHVYEEKCMFDVFLEICREDYVGTYYGTSNSKMIHKICKNFLNYAWNRGLKLATAS